MPWKEIYFNMKANFKKGIPDSELKYKAHLVYEINCLKKEKNAVILGHNYMDPTLYYSICDFVGDSLELSRKAAETDKDIIVFCGVRFMAETAKILSPKKTVLLPVKEAGCSLAESITAEDVRGIKERFPGLSVVTYINTSAEVKAESDVCCTSSNAASVVESLDTEKVIFIPDEYLAKNTARQTKKTIIVPSNSADNKSISDSGRIYQMIGWNGRCEVHEKFTCDDISSIRQQFPSAVILSHPECSPEVVAKSDFSGSTSAMSKYIQHATAKQFVLFTDCAMGDNVAIANPTKEILPLCRIRCPHMEKITLETTLHALQHNEEQIDMPENVLTKAFRAIENMLCIRKN
jgi:quinolinate synthase